MQRVLIWPSPLHEKHVRGGFREELVCCPLAMIAEVDVRAFTVGGTYGEALGFKVTGSGCRQNTRGLSNTSVNPIAMSLSNFSGM